MSWSNNKYFEGAFNVCSNSARSYTSGKKKIKSITKPTFTRQSKMDALRKKFEILKSKKTYEQTLADNF